MLDFLSDYKLNFLDKILLPAIKATFEMLIYSTILSVIFGFFAVSYTHLVAKLLLGVAR